MAEQSKKSVKEETIYVYELQFGKSDNYDYIRSRQYSSKIECLKNLIKRYEDEKPKSSYIQGRMINLLTGEYFEL